MRGTGFLVSLLGILLAEATAAGAAPAGVRHVVVVVLENTDDDAVVS